MKLPIKFRGKMWGTDKLPNFNGLVYGDLLHYTDAVVIVNKHGQYQVEPDSVTQLVGYDKNGREVYEGDALQTENGVTIYAYVLRHAKIAPTKDLDFTEMAKEDGWTVKEAEKNGNDV